jgi:hypothetical protein
MEGRTHFPILLFSPLSLYLLTSRSRRLLPRSGQAADAWRSDAMAPERRSTWWDFDLGWRIEEDWLLPSVPLAGGTCAESMVWFAFVIRSHTFQFELTFLTSIILFRK